MLSLFFSGPALVNLFSPVRLPHHVPLLSSGVGVRFFLILSPDFFLVFSPLWLGVALFFFFSPLSASLRTFFYFFVDGRKFRCFSGLW